ncbi:hypothetical protein [Nocardiopsis algeriensis]|uniref:Uncharacterized protein n=1 Tax=Nocardiopsis algeriensis TaxID=1478215 RepID=A0A841IV51_9ACTN|nr:hypothetical protein [Nocardiopsis algeriensis]MBB6122204.1 hypothetical protein [Nocardiopsis algeriensis]
MRTIDPTDSSPPSPFTGVQRRECTLCQWEVVSGSALVAELEAATHRVEAHSTTGQRQHLAALLQAYREVLGPLPRNLLVLAVQQVLGPAPAPLATVCGPRTTTSQEQGVAA